jgi:outer membrane protein assembly factor BamB
MREKGIHPPASRGVSLGVAHRAGWTSLDRWVQCGVMRIIWTTLAAIVAVATTSAAGWPTNHGDNQRSGYNPAEKSFSGFSIAFSVRLDGAAYGSPILVGSNVIVATENNSVYALDAGTGVQRWRTRLRIPAQPSSLACPGNISPSGITGTPAYDPVTKRVFVVTNQPDARTGAHHEIFGLLASSGWVVMNRRIAVPGQAENAEQQRAALAVDRGNVYVAFGGLAGDCGQYKGAVISLKANGQLGATAWVVPTTREAGIWAPGGPVVATDGSVYVAIGNGESTSGAYDGSDSVTRISPTSQRLDFFAPSTWASDNAADLDLGSMTPALTANGFILQAGKSGNGYVLRASHLGGIGGQVSAGALCRAFGVSAVTGNTVYLPCTDGVTRVDVNSNGTFTKRWTASGGVVGSPVVGPGGVYSLANGRLYALWSGNGLPLGSIALGATTTRFATPALGGNRVYVGTTTGLISVRVG